jgi:hypothetical protein
VDRRDLELLKATFHHDGEVIFGIFDGNAHEFCEFDVPFIKNNLIWSYHRVANATIVIDPQDPNKAYAESYMLGNASAQIPDGPQINCPDCMRYRDVWIKRDGVWRMWIRDLIMDWNGAWDYTQRDDGPMAQYTIKGHGDERDMIYSAGLVQVL